MHANYKISALFNFLTNLKFRAFMKYTLDDFDYNLPEELIAKYPSPSRTKCRLLSFAKETNKVKHEIFSDIITYFKPNDLLVVNESKVMNARLFGNINLKGISNTISNGNSNSNSNGNSNDNLQGKKVEVFIERILSNNLALAKIYPAKAVRNIDNDTYITIKDIKLKILEKNTTDKFKDFYKVELPKEFNINFLDVLSNYGEVPLPPYMKRSPDNNDIADYQTVYANSNHLGSIAAPTAGLHFDDDLLLAIKNKGVKIDKITLHVGSGTFQSVNTNNIYEHKMHSEYVEVSSETCENILKTKKNNGKIIAVGTTTVRSLESAALTGELKPFYGDTSIFITPGFKFNVIDALVTNFHIPRSTLLMLVCAFANHKGIMSAYQEAIKNKYMFYSYGDAMFIN